MTVVIEIGFVKQERKITYALSFSCTEYLRRLIFPPGIFFLWPYIAESVLEIVFP